MQQLLFIDQQLFLIFNHLPHGRIFNLFAQLFSGMGTAGIIWFFLAAILFLKEEKKDHWFFLPVLLAGGASWILVEQVFKPLIGRVRPTIDMGAIIVGSIKTDPSFPSGHATIAWAMAVVLSHKEPRWRWIFYVLAFLISFSRIYLGKHYPLDVLVGGIIGWGIGEWAKKMRRRK